MDVKIQAIHSIRCLYSDCVEVRCAPVWVIWTSPVFVGAQFHVLLRGSVTNRLTTGKAAEKQAESHMTHLLTVMEFGLGFNNSACIESALHGLWHTIHIT